MLYSVRPMCVHCIDVLDEMSQLALQCMRQPCIGSCRYDISISEPQNHGQFEKRFREKINPTLGRVHARATSDLSHQTSCQIEEVIQ